MTHPATDFHGTLDPLSVLSAVERSLCEWYRSLADAMPGASYIEEADHARVTSPVAHPACNAVLGAKLERSNVAERIRAVLSDFERRDSPALWWVGPSSKPVDQHAYLMAAGLELTETLYGMAADLQCMPDAPPTPAGWMVEVVKSPHQLADWMRPFADAFHMSGDVLRDLAPIGQSLLSVGSPIRLLVGSLDGKPASCAALMLGTGVAGLYYVGTRAALRRIGCASALVVAAMRAARDEGYRLCVLHSSPLSVDLYQRLGYMEYCRLRTLLWKPSSQRRR